jgi:two-component system, NtrC family, sensor kinase
MTATLDDEIADLRRANGELQRRLDEALAERDEFLRRETATAEVLQVINSSTGDLAPVFDAILEKAMRLCGAAFGAMGLFKDGKYSSVADRGLPAAYAQFRRQRISSMSPSNPSLVVFRGLHGESIIHSLDLKAEDPYEQGDPYRRAIVDLGGARTSLAVVLKKDGDVLGGINLYRQEVQPFSDKQIALLQNFAAQAVIAMENARLLTETREALEQQTATAEVLQVINSSPGNLAPVFETLLERAMRLCEAGFGGLLTYDGAAFHHAAHLGHRAFSDWVRKQGSVKPEPGTTMARIVNGENVIQVVDTTDDEGYRTGSSVRRAVVEIGGFHTLLSVALRKEQMLLGVIHIFRQEVRPFTDKQIALLQNFAAQAVIAIENARLLTETREALEQQTATAEVLQVINSSPGDLAPVFEAILDKARTLCGAVFGGLFLCEEEHFRAVAVRGGTEAWHERVRLGFRGSETPVSAPLLSGERFVHIVDAAEIDHPMARAAVEAVGTRSLLSVPLRKGDALFGMIVAARPEVRAFSDKEIALLQNFAAQAVIAMENARLLTETREALEQQTATAEVLQVINSSPGDLKPVFDAMLDKAIHLCDSAFGTLWTRDGESFHAVALHRVPAAFANLLANAPYRPEPGSHHERLMQGEPFVQTEDVALETRIGPVRQALVEQGGARSIIAVPLRKDGAVLGVISAYRQEVRPFSDKQIALLQNFAAQAVIAMENARLLNEIRQRQAELRVTFDNMVDGVAMFDAELRLAAWNRHFQELLELSDDFLAERHGFDEFVRYLTERGEFGETDPEAEINRLRGRLHEHYQFERTRPDGTVIEIRHNPMPDGGVVLIYSDITERKRSEAEIHAARDAAEAAYRDLKAAQASLIQAEKMASLGQLTAGIAHEIKNPLNFINNFAGLSVELLDELKETAAPAINALGDEKRAEIDETITMLTGNLEKIAEHGHRADNIVTSMLEHSRGSSGERRSVDLNGLIEEALNLAYHGGRAQDASFDITLERDYADALAPIELVPQDITRVCLNLFSNGFYAAIKRQKQGTDPKFKPTLKVSTRDLGDAVEIGVRDNGVGIQPEIKDKLFQPFFTTKPTGEGTGLGLSISYDIVTQEHGGTIRVASQIGEFTEFTVRLPRVYGTTIAEAAS